MRTVAVLAVALFGAGCSPDQPALEPEAPARPAGDKTIIGDAFAGPGGPSAVYLDGALFLTFTGTDNNINVVRSNDNGASWAPPITLAEQAPMGASISTRPLPANQQELVLVWFDNDNAFNSLRSSDGASWIDRQIFNVKGPGFRANGQPALVNYAGFPFTTSGLHAFYSIVPTTDSNAEWNSRGGIHRYDLHEDGEWSYGGGFPAQTRGAVSAAELGSDLLVVWTHRDRQSLRTKKFIWGRDWANTNFVDRHHEGTLFDARTSPSTGVVWVYRETEGPEADMLKFDRTTNGVDFNWILNTDHFSFGRPFGVRQVGNSWEFAHVGTDGAASINYNTVTF